MMFRLSFSIFVFLAVYPFMVQSDEASVVDIDKLVEKAKQGDMEAQFDLGVVRRDGSNGLKKSARKALKWFTKAALQGNPKAMFAVGLMHRHGGKGIRMNAETALHWFKNAAKHGDARANLNLGHMILNEEVENSAEAASPIHHFELAAKGGLAEAEFELGDLHFYGKGHRGDNLCQGIPKNAKDSLRWYTKAAKQGHAKAQFCLGNLLLNGAKGVDKNRAKAIEWYTKAADQKFMEAMYTLGSVLMEDSDQEYHELIKVYILWEKAVRRGHDKAAKGLESLRYKLKLLEKDMPKEEQSTLDADDDEDEDEPSIHDNNPENVHSAGSGSFIPKSSSHRYRAGAYGN